MTNATRSRTGGAGVPDGELDRTQRRRTAILDAAVRVISKQGADHARLVDIAAEAKVSVGMIQHYFRTRSNLMSEVFSRKLNESLLVYEDSNKSDRSATEDIVELCHLLIREPFDEIFSMWLEFFSLANRDLEFRKLSGVIYERWVQLVRDVIAKGIQRGEFRPAAPAEAIADELVSLADGLGLRVLLGHPRMNPAYMCDLLLGVMSTALGVDLRATAKDAQRYQSVLPASD